MGRRRRIWSSLWGLLDDEVGGDEVSDGEESAN